MDDPDKYEFAKMEIRGLLISNKEGCYLSEFKKQYRSMLGRTLPFAQFGYKNEIEFLSAMPDVVQISSMGRDYHLFGIADVNTRHIQKMVSKQKTNKKKPLGRLNPMSRINPRILRPPPPSYAPKKSYELPPRFQTNTTLTKELPKSVMNEIVDLVCKYPAGLSLRDVLVGYRRIYNKELSFKDYGFFTLQECLEEIPSLIFKPILNDIFVLCSSEIEKPCTESSKVKNVSRDKLTDEYTDKIQNANVLPGRVRYVDYEYFEKKNKPPAINEVPKISKVTIPTVQNSESAVGFSFATPPDRPNFELPSYDPFSFSDFPADSSNDFFSGELTRIPSPQESASNSKHGLAFSPYKGSHDIPSVNLKAEYQDNFNIKDNTADSSVSEKVRENLIRVVENYPHGIWAREFPALYKEVTKTEFDLHSLGFYNLTSFIDSVPDILTRKSLPNSKKDYLIYSAWTKSVMDREDSKSAAFAIEIIIGNTRKILQANGEGIPLKEFLYVYCLNCSEPLYYIDLGFDSLENLLITIADRVPLKFQTKEGVKSVHLVLSEDTYVLPPPKDSQTLPANFVSPFNQFTLQTLPTHLDLGQFFPVYVSSVINPEHIYIQLKETNAMLLEKYQDLEKFYSSKQNKNCFMKDVHIAAGSIGVALWPTDMHWYRVRIMSVTSPETVQVFYVDYGTIEIIPKRLLRYIREEFFDFPTQAIKASLAYIKPPLGNNTWNPNARARILELCTDIVIMAKINDIEQDGLLSIVLCDTNGEEDVFVNDALLNEHLARQSADVDSNSHCRVPQESPQGLPEISPLTLPSPSLPLASANQSLPLSGQATDPTQVIGILLQAYSSLTANKASSTSPNLPLDPAFVTAVAQAAQNLSQNSFTPSTDFSKQFQSPLAPAISPIPGPKPKVNESWQFPPTSLDHPGETASVFSSTPSSDESSEIFDDDIDAFFDEFYQKVSLVMKRYVKRVRTGDGYMFHILICDSKPYVSCGDICSLIWSSKGPDYLLQQLQNLEPTLPNTLIWKNKNEDMFDQLNRFHVKGCKEHNDQTCILIYPLNTLVQILNKFGHPSVELRRKILSEASSFDAKHPMWMELSEVEIPDGDEEFAGKTDDDKLNRLCLYDLQTMRQGILIRRQNLDLRRAKSPEEVSDEEEKLRLVYNKVIRRIKEIEQICSNFAEA